MKKLKHILTEKSRLVNRSNTCKVCDYELYRDGFLIKIPSSDLKAWLCPCCKSIFDIDDDTPIIILPDIKEGIA